MKAEIIDNKLTLFPESNTENYGIGIFLEGPMVDDYNNGNIMPIEIDTELLLERDN